MSNSTKSETDKAPARKGYSPKKGVPTPKRKEAARELRRPLSAPKTRREAYKLMWERERRRRQRERAGLVKPEDRYSAPGPRSGPCVGPRLCRLAPHAQRVLPVLSLAIIVLMFVPVPEVQLFAAYVCGP